MKRIYKVILLLILLLPISSKAIVLPNLVSKNVVLYDPSLDEILYEKDADKVVSIASLTKIMTTIVAIENIDDIDEVVTITWDMLKEVPIDASIAGLKTGDRVSYRDLLYASILPSGADATISLSHLVFGSTEKFIDLMNEKAKELELTHTHFVNVTGYDDEKHYSTALEVLKLLKYALKNELFNTIYNTKSYQLSNGLVVKSTLNKYGKNSSNDFSSILGSKTGFTDGAGLCMSALIKVKDKELIFISLGAPNVYGKSYNLEDTLTVIDYLNENYQNEVIYPKDYVLFDIPVIDSKIESYQVKVGKDIILYTTKLDESERGYEYFGLNELSYKNKKGDKIGTIEYHYQDKTFREEVYLEEEILFSFPKYFKSHLYIFIIIFILILLAVFIFLVKRKKKRRKKRRRLKW